VVFVRLSDIVMLVWIIRQTPEEWQQAVVLEFLEGRRIGRTKKVRK